MRRMAVQFMFLAIIIYFMLTELKIKKVRFFIINVLFISLLFQFTNFLQFIRVSEVDSVGKAKILRKLLLKEKFLIILQTMISGKKLKIYQSII